jgi:protein O-GlcNAc transferase
MVDELLKIATEHHSAGRLEEATAAYRQVLALEPKNPVATSRLDALWLMAADTQLAVELNGRVMGAEAGSALHHYARGVGLLRTGRWGAAEGEFRQVLMALPEIAIAHSHLGTALTELGRLDEALGCFRQALALRPIDAISWNRVANTLQRLGRFDEAIEIYGQGLARFPGDSLLHNNLGMAFQGVGRLTEALAEYRRGLEIRPDYALCHGNLLYAMQFQGGVGADQIAAEHARWERIHAEPLRGRIVGHGNDPSPDRVLRVGYVSPDFREHVVGRSLLPLVMAHRLEQVQVFCYSNVRKPDALTEAFRRCAVTWREILGVDDERAAQMIRDDRIDILVDLALHMEGNRILIFARKPTPVQVTYLGYCGTTGLRTMDYRLADPYLGADSEAYVEKTIRLPRSYWCYGRPDTQAAVGPAPAAGTGAVTFGCLNHFVKVTPEAIALWAQVMRAVPRARMILHAPAGMGETVARERFGAVGITGDRMEFVDRQPWPQYMRTFERIDVALDPIPYGGGITTCDGLWMGVPIVTLADDRAVGRGGLSIVSNIGLPELAARTEAKFVSIAVELAGDLPRLSALRAGMRERMVGSALMDSGRFAGEVEGVYRQMWREWCASRG